MGPRFLCVRTAVCVRVACGLDGLAAVCIRPLRFSRAFSTVEIRSIRFSIAFCALALREVFASSTVLLRTIRSLCALSAPCRGPRHIFWVDRDDFWKNVKILSEFVRFAYVQVEFYPDFSVRVRSRMCDDCLVKARTQQVGCASD